MERTAVNPNSWSQEFNFNQAELIDGARRVLVCAGQTSVDDAGEAVHAGDMPGQLARLLDNLEAVLQGAGMTLADVVRIIIYTTDVDLYLEHRHVLEGRLQRSGTKPPATLLGVTRLAIPELLVEVQATAMQ
jgi:enamine deaminase RidA (YjgF/YER057c/UK114 family)